MFEGLAASLLNKTLGKYILNLESENIKVGITSGHVELTDLQLRPEALFELNLPIEVKAGYVGKINLRIPWRSLYTSPVELILEDVYVLAGPVTDHGYDARKDRNLQNAIKRKKLADLETGASTSSEESSAKDQSFTEKLVATIINNIQVSIQRIHIRYEDKVTNPDHPFACGIMLKMMSAETTNNQWQPTTVDGTETRIHKLVRLHALSAYWNPYLPDQSLVRTKLHTSAWRSLLKNSINTHRIMEEDFDFIIHPISASSKMVVNKDDTCDMPRLMADFAMEEIEVLISRQQFLNMLSLADSFKMMSVNQRYRKNRPEVTVKASAAAWWKYAYSSVVEETIRPFSWRNISMHRKKYRTYRDLYKQKLDNPENKNILNRLRSLEDELDIANMLMAREHAKLEFAREAPERAKKTKKKKAAWFSWMFSSSSDSEDEEVVISHPSNMPKWVDQLSSEEKKKLYNAVGFDENQNVEHSPQYVAHKFNLSLALCSLSLVNYGKEVLKVSLSQLTSSLENRPDTDGFRFSMIVPVSSTDPNPSRVSAKTESFIVEGVSIEHELVPLITSDIGVYAPSILTQVFSFEFEKCPNHVDADFSLRLNVQPVEIVYDEHAVTEVIAFFQVPHISADDVKQKATDSLERLALASRAGLQYAIEQHMTVHLSVNMRSPYVVIPEYGTLHRGGNVLVLDFGKLKIESDLQPKNICLEECTMSEIQSRLYDKFNITVTEVKVLLADSGDDWHTAQTKLESEFHILPSVGMQLAFFNTVKPDYKQLPQQKLEARLPSLKLSLSDEKLQMLAEFFKHIPVPRSSSMMGLDDSVDGHIEPVVPIMVDTEVQMEPTYGELNRMKQAVLKNSVIRRKKKSAAEAHSRGATVSVTESEHYYSASDHSDEEVDDWARGLDVKAVDDHTSQSNSIKVFARFVLGEVVLHISKSADKIDTPYLMLRVDRLCADAAVTIHGLAVQASLGGIQLVDKIHLGLSGEYLEMLSSKSNMDLITMVYRKVEPDCPDFDAIYRSIEQGAVLKFSSLKVTFDRAATLYLHSFLQGLLLSLQGPMDSHMRKSTSTILSAVTTEMPQYQPEAPSFIQRLTSQTDEVPLGLTKVHIVAKLDDLTVQLCDHDNEFSDIQVRGFESNLIVKATRTTIHARLTDLSIQDLTENTLYPRVLTIEDDKAFDFKLVNYVQLPPKLGIHKDGAVESSVRLRVGRIQATFLHKFVSEIMNFMEPFINPELTESYKIAAQQAMHNKIQDVQEQGTRFSLNLDLRSPTVIIPQHSESTNVISLKLGDLSLKNFFEDTEVSGIGIAPGVTQKWDHMYMNLSDMQVIRGKLNLNGNIEHVHTVAEPITWRLDFKRALPPHRTDLFYIISSQLRVIKVELTQQDIKVMMAVLRENLLEVSNKPEKVDESDLTPMTDRPLATQESLETTTPVVEIEEPLLSAPEVSELVKQTKFEFVMDGVALTLLSEEDDPLAPTSPVRDEGESLAYFEIGKFDLSGVLNNDSSLEVQLVLASVCMDDIRPNSNLAVKRLVRSSLLDWRSAEPVAPMVDIAYKQTSEGNRHVEINMETVRLNLCVPYLLMVNKFFTDALQTPEVCHHVPSQKAPEPKVSLVRRASQWQPTMAIPPPVTKEAGALTVCGRFRQLEIVLFAEPTEKHSRVLVLKANTILDYFSLNEREHLEVKVKQLQIVSCVYGSANQTASMVLYPCDMELTRIREAKEAGLEINAKISDVYLNVSATTLHIFMDVVQMINKDAAKQPCPETHDPGLGSSQHYDLWRTRDMTSEKYMKPPEQPEIQPAKFPLIPDKPPSETLQMECNKLQIMFEVENLDFHVPRLCIRSGLQATVHDWSKQLRVEGEAQLEVSYYNEKLAVWEPLVEPVMVTEGSYRPWEVLVKMVRAQSHPIACNAVDFKLEKRDDIDGDVHYLMTRARANSDSSETDSDSETEMTIIKPSMTRRTRLGSNQSYDSVSHHSDVQGESDSEPELLSTISSTFDSMFSSGDSSDGMSECDDDPFENTDKPVFLTAKGPIHVSTGEEAMDEVDAVFGSEDEDALLCSYLMIDSRDQLLVNLSPPAIDVILEVSETFLRSQSSTLKSVHDLPGFEIYNELDIPAKVTLSPELKNLDVVDFWCPHKPQLFTDLDQIGRNSLHHISNTNPGIIEPEESILVDLSTDEVDGDMDMVDGLSFLAKAVGKVGHTLISSGAFVFDDRKDRDPVDSEGLGPERMHVMLEGFDDITNISHKKAESRLIPLSPYTNETQYMLAYQVDVKHGRKVVTIRSPLQLSNHLTVSLNIYCKTVEVQKYSTQLEVQSQGEFTLLKVLEPDQVYNVPLYVAYHCKLYASPADTGYEKTSTAIWWQDLSVAKERSRLFSCLPTDTESTPVNFKAVCEEGSCRPPKGFPGQSKLVPNFTLHLHPPVVLHNLLPYHIQFQLEGSPLTVLDHGDKTPLYSVDVAKCPKLHLQVCEYLGCDWMGCVELSNDLEEFKAITMEADINVEGQNKQLSLSIHVNRENLMDLFLYSPYWVVNKTGLPIKLRGSRSEAVYDNDISSDPLLFRFKKHRRKKAKLKVYNSKWTHSFSLDTVGTGGVIICNDKERNRKYHFLLQIQMSHLKLTKIVTLMPYFLVVNNTAHHLRYMEENEQADLWMDLQPHECTAFWPATDSLKMYIKHQDSKVSSQHFCIQKPHMTVLRMDKGSALCVEVAGGTETSLTITFTPYEHGDAPVRIENLCEDVFFKLHQKNQSQVSLLSPNQSILYTWDDPTSERTLMWNVYNRKKPSYPAFISKDGCDKVPLSIQTIRRSSFLGNLPSPKGKDREKKRETGEHAAHDSSSDDDSDTEITMLVPPSPMVKGTKTDKVMVYWVSYLDGLQRVLLFTQDERVARQAKKVNEAEQANLAVFLSLGGIGLSLINGLYEEVAFMTLAGSSAVWEVEVKNKWKPLTMELASWLEEKWRSDERKIVLEDFVEADLERMVMKKPFIGALRRSYNPALWLQYKQSEHHTYLHTKIQRLQIDNQLNDAYFPSVLYPSPLPPYIVKRSGPKPFLELALVRRQVPESDIDTFKYVKLLMQEFHLHIDKGFIMSAYNVFADRLEQTQESKQLKADLALVQKTLRELAAVQVAARPQKIVFEYLHLSPVKLCVSFSLDGHVHSATAIKGGSITSDVVDFFMNSVGATFTEVKEVELRMAYFERQGAMLTFSQLMSEVQSHYISQAVQQAYVLLLGLDVLGNPYGLVKDFTQGLGDFFYEPFLGSIQGPDKFAQHLVWGVRSLLGHTVGSAAGSVSLITGSLGKTLSVLSFDKDYRKKRLQYMQQHPSHLPESFFLAGKSFMMGVALGLSGVVANPVRGAREEGLEGFFKGVGKGLMGLLTKPTVGAIDMVSMAFDGIRRASEMGESVVLRMRLARHINPSLGVKPFSRYEAVGSRILRTVAKGKYIDSDIYWGHAALSAEEKADLCLVTTKRVLVLERCKFWGEWSVELDVLLDDMLTMPVTADNMLLFKVKRDDASFNPFTSDDKEVHCENQETLQWLLKKIEKAAQLSLDSN